MSRAWVWTLASGVASAAIGLLVATALGANPGGGLNGGLLVGMAAVPAIALAYWLLFAGCTHGVARLLGGQGGFSRLAGVFAALSAPLVIVTSLLYQLPWTGVALLVLYVYWLVLYTGAVRAVHGFSLSRAVIAVLMSLALLVGAGFGTTLAAILATRA